MLNSGSTVPCGLGGMYARVSLIVDWINRVTENCNMETCCKDQCVSKDKLKPQALEMLVTENVQFEYIRRNENGI